MAIRPGDSGGLVFSITGDTRQARGINSAGTDNDRTMFWTEAIDIYNSFGVHLAPPPPGLVNDGAEHGPRGVAPRR